MWNVIVFGCRILSSHASKTDAEVWVDLFESDLLPSDRGYLTITYEEPEPYVSMYQALLDD